MSEEPDSSKNEIAPPPGVRYLDTTAAYDLWAKVYDTDGNFLQALDSIEMKSLLPDFLAQISAPQPWTLVDLGCGTGRNTAALLAVPEATVVGLDASPQMLKVARSRLGSDRLRLDVFDLLADSPQAMEAHAVISTLVLEHIPIDTFFQAATAMLRAGGKLLVTNMHAEMGGISQAGFVDPSTGEKIRPVSYAHRLEDVISGAQKYGFEVIGEPLERSVDVAMSERLGPRAKKWVGVTVWFGIMFSKMN